MSLLILGLYITALSCLTLFGGYRLWFVYRLARLRPRDPAVPAYDPAALPPVTVQLPVYNELYVVDRLMRAACAIEYPRHLLQIQVLDDSSDGTTEMLAGLVTEMRAAGVCIVHIRRRSRDGYKAGALRNGLKSATGEFIAVFDADFLPTPDFLLRTIPHFSSDDALGMVQARWAHLNEGYSLLTRMQAMALDGHFAVEQQVRGRSGLFINFNGTAGVWRRVCIEDAGNWQSDTLTEDLDLSYRAQLMGWRFLYLNEVSVPAELPAEIDGLKSQQFRWTKGTMQTARKHLGGLWHSRFPFRVKAHATMHLLSNSVYPLILVIALLNIPVILIKFSDPSLVPVFNAMAVFLLATAATIVFCAAAQRDIHRNWVARMLIFPAYMAGMTGLAVTNTRAIAEALLNRVSEFRRTPKYNVYAAGDLPRHRHYGQGAGTLEILTELGLALYFMAGILIAAVHGEPWLIPFQALFVAGFGVIGGLSLRGRIMSV